MFRIPLFTWGVLVTQLLILFAFPPLTAALALLFLDRNFGSVFFDATAGGSQLLFQHQLPEVHSERPAFDQRHGLEFADAGADTDLERNPDRG